MNKISSKVYISQSQISKNVDRLAFEIDSDYQNKSLVIIGVLKGALMFMSDLIRRLTIQIEIDFVGISSYKDTESTGIVKLVNDISTPLEGRNVLIAEDIVDTGLTSSYLLQHLRAKKPSSLKLCSLLDKPSCRIFPIKIDYVGLTIPNKFVFGYGMDLNGQFRNFTDIYEVTDEGTVRKTN